MKEIKIKDKILKIPIIQGGMGVGVSLSQLAGNVMKNNCLGVISAAHPGYNYENFEKNTNKVNYEALITEIKKAKAIAQGNGILGVNLMVALEDYANMVKAAIKGGADILISGAGIPLDLPEYDENESVALAPIVSSGKVATLICKKWDRKYNRVPDIIIIEGSQAGGHLGFKAEEIDSSNLLDILNDVKKAIIPFKEKYNKEIPIFIAGGIFDENDIAKALKAGADGVQIGTRFIATHEADCHDNFKKAIIDSKKEDIVIVKSPVGMPGRALLTPLIKRLEKGSIPITRCYDCLKPCNPANTPYCISDALIASAKGDIENGLFFCGSYAYRINKIESVKSLIDNLVSKTNQIFHGK